MPAHQQYTVFRSMDELEFIEKDPKLPWTVFVGAAGMPGWWSTCCGLNVDLFNGYSGKTAYMGWKEFSRAKKVASLGL